VVIPDAHHAVPMEAPEKFNTALSAFLSNYFDSIFNSPHAKRPEGCRSSSLV